MPLHDVGSLHALDAVACGTVDALGVVLLQVGIRDVRAELRGEEVAELPTGIFSVAVAAEAEEGGFLQECGEIVDALTAVLREAAVGVGAGVFGFGVAQEEKFHVESLGSCGIGRNCGVVWSTSPGVWACGRKILGLAMGVEADQVRLHPILLGLPATHEKAMSAIHRSILIGRFLLAGWIGSLIPLAAEPVSSAGYGEALRMAEQIAAQDPSWRVFGCEGASMGDFYGSHSLLLVKEARLHEVREGMMVVYRGREGLLIAHKVIAHHGSWLRTQGVMNERPDPVYVRADMVVGTVFGVLHTNGDRSGALESKDGRLLPTAYCRRY